MRYLLLALGPVFPDSILGPVSHALPLYVKFQKQVCSAGIWNTSSANKMQGEHWVEAKDEAGVGTGAKIELARDAAMWNWSHGAKKKSQISTFYHIEVFILRKKKNLFLSLSVVIC